MSVAPVNLAAPKRLKQLQIRHILDTPREEAFDRLTRLAAAAIRAPVALLTFVDDRRQWFKSSYGLPEPWATRRETPLTHSFCQYVVISREPLIVSDARKEALVRDNLAIPDIGVIAYLGVPLIDVDGSVLGSFAIVDSEPREWTQDELRMAQDFAQIAMKEVQLRTEIVQRSEAEEALRQSQKLEAVGRLAGGIAHDFNNMLIIIHGYAALLREEIAPTDARTRFVEEIRKAAERATALTRQLLAFSRKQMLKLQPLDLNAVVRDLESMLGRALGETIQLRLALEDELRLIEADRPQIEQVILNLVLNARDAIKGAGVVTLRTINHPPGFQPHGASSTSATDWVELQVADSGAGMDEETLAHVFEPFYTTKESGHGTGLGLATVYGVVRQSRGYVWAESAVDQGSIFHVAFPSTRGKQPEASPVKAPARVAIGASLLIVEDEDGVRNLIVAVLERAGYRVHSAKTPQEALEHVRSSSAPIDLAVLDVVMPQMNGRELAERLRTLRPNLNVLFMSGYTDDYVLRQGVEHEKVKFIDKPVSPEQLIERVASALLERDGEPNP